MKNQISDLTRDFRPSLESILIESIHDTVDVDKHKPNDNGDLVQYENYTFYYRVIFLFMQRVVKFYDNHEIENWCKTELLKELMLPKIEEIKNSIQ